MALLTIRFDERLSGDIDMSSTGLPGGESEVSISIVFAFRESSSITTTLQNVNKVLVHSGDVKWLRPLKANDLEGDWSLDLDAIKVKFRNIAGSWDWINGVESIKPSYSKESAFHSGSEVKFYFTHRQ